MNTDAQPPKLWSIAEVLEWTRQHFEKRGIDSPRLDAELLLSHVLAQPRLYLYTHFDKPLSQAERDAFRELVQRRARREPVALILGEREFYGRPFTINRDVLSPRPETEHLVDSVREWVSAQDLAAPRVLDVGVGSGAIALTLAAELAGAQVVGTELSPAALEVARLNAARLGVQVTLLEGDLFAPLPKEQRFDVIAANPPYIPRGEKPSLMPEVRDFEPELALFGGDDGLEVVRRLVQGLGARLASPGLFVMEMGAGQWPAVRDLLGAHGPWARLHAVRDLAGHERIAVAERA